MPTISYLMPKSNAAIRTRKMPIVCRKPNCPPENKTEDAIVLVTICVANNDGGNNPDTLLIYNTHANHAFLKYQRTNCVKESRNNSKK